MTGGWSLCNAVLVHGWNVLFVGNLDTSAFLVKRDWPQALLNFPGGKIKYLGMILWHINSGEAFRPV